MENSSGLHYLFNRDYTTISGLHYLKSRDYTILFWETKQIFSGLHYLIFGITLLDFRGNKQKINFVISSFNFLNPCLTWDYTTFQGITLPFRDYTTSNFGITLPYFRDYTTKNLGITLP